MSGLGKRFSAFLSRITRRFKRTGNSKPKKATFLYDDTFVGSEFKAGENFDVETPVPQDKFGRPMEEMHDPTVIGGKVYSMPEYAKTPQSNRDQHIFIPPTPKGHLVAAQQRKDERLVKEVLDAELHEHFETQAQLYPHVHRRRAGEPSLAPKLTRGTQKQNMPLFEPGRLTEVEMYALCCRHKSDPIKWTPAKLADRYGLTEEFVEVLLKNYSAPVVYVLPLNPLHPNMVQPVVCKDRETFNKVRDAVGVPEGMTFHDDSLDVRDGEVLGAALIFEEEEKLLEKMEQYRRMHGDDILSQKQRIQGRLAQLTKDLAGSNRRR